MNLKAHNFLKLLLIDNNLITSVLYIFILFLKIFNQFLDNILKFNVTCLMLTRLVLSLTIFKYFNRVVVIQNWILGIIRVILPSTISGN